MKKLLPPALAILLLSLAIWSVRFKGGDNKPPFFSHALDSPGAAEPSSAHGSPLPLRNVAADPADQAKIRLLDEILSSRNDNDPRLDTEFRHLSDAAKSLLREHYHSYAAEKRNERGTIVFLIGREMSNEADFKFMHEVLSETACKSLSDCGSADGSPTKSEDLHHESGSEVTLAYPQMVALHSIENFLSTPHTSALGADVTEILEMAKNSPIAVVAQKAQQILQHLGR